MEFSSRKEYFFFMCSLCVLRLSGLASLLAVVLKSLLISVITPVMTSILPFDEYVNIIIKTSLSSMESQPKKVIVGVVVVFVLVVVVVVVAVTVFVVVVEPWVSLLHPNR